jgi:hypothetical protein
VKEGTDIDVFGATLDIVVASTAKRPNEVAS